MHWLLYPQRKGPWNPIYRKLEELQSQSGLGEERKITYYEDYGVYTNAMQFKETTSILIAETLSFSSEML
jgi:hypothetical protein